MVMQSAAVHVFIWLMFMTTSYTRALTFDGLPELSSLYVEASSVQITCGLIFAILFALTIVLTVSLSTIGFAAYRKSSLDVIRNGDMTIVSLYEMMATILVRVQVAYGAGDVADYDVVNEKKEKKKDNQNVDMKIDKETLLQHCLDKPLAIMYWIRIASTKRNHDQLLCLLMIRLVQNALWQKTTTAKADPEKSKPFLKFLYNFFVAEDDVNVGSAKLQSTLKNVMDTLSQKKWDPTKDLFGPLVSDLKHLIKDNNFDTLTNRDRKHLMDLANHKGNSVFRRDEFFAAMDKVLMEAYVGLKKTEKEKINNNNNNNNNNAVSNAVPKQRNSPSLGTFDANAALDLTIPGSAYAEEATLSAPGGGNDALSMMPTQRGQHQRSRPSPIFTGFTAPVAVPTAPLARSSTAYFVYNDKKKDDEGPADVAIRSTDQFKVQRRDAVVAMVIREPIHEPTPTLSAPLSLSVPRSTLPVTYLPTPRVVHSVHHQRLTQLPELTQHVPVLVSSSSPVSPPSVV